MPDSTTPDRSAVSDELGLTGRRAFVTGAGSGIGRAIAVALAEAGAVVHLAGRRVAQLEAVRDEIAGAGGLAHTEPVDVTDTDAVAAAAERARERSGGVDIVVNCAGNVLFKPLVPLPGLRPPSLPEFGEPTSDKDWDDVFSVHVRGAMAVLRAFGPALIEQRSGRVINVTSDAVARVARFNSAYEAAKAALGQLTRSVAVEWARSGVTVNAIAPGHFATDLSRELHETAEGRRWMMSRIPMQRVGDLRDLGALAVFLASDRASFITGQTIFVDGGETL